MCEEKTAVEIRRNHIHIQLRNKINIFIGALALFLIVREVLGAVFRRELLGSLKAFLRESNQINLSLLRLLARFSRIRADAQILSRVPMPMKEEKLNLFCFVSLKLRILLIFQMLFCNLPVIISASHEGNSISLSRSCGLWECERGDSFLR